MIRLVKFIVIRNRVSLSEKHYASNFFTHLWSVGTALILHTQNPEISGFSTAQMYKYKTKPQANIKRRKTKSHFCWLVSSV